MFRSISLCLLAIAGGTSAAAAGDMRATTTGDREVIVEWNMLLEGTVPNSAGPTLPRYYAMMHIAMFDAVNSIEGGYVPYRAKVPALRVASTDAAAAQAAHDVLVALLP